MVLTDGSMSGIGNTMHRVYNEYMHTVYSHTGWRSCSGLLKRSSVTLPLVTMKLKSLLWLIHDKVKAQTHFTHTQISVYIQKYILSAHNDLFIMYSFTPLNLWHSKITLNEQLVESSEQSRFESHIFSEVCFTNVTKKKSQEIFNNKPYEIRSE